MTSHHFREPRDDAPIPARGDRTLAGLPRNPRGHGDGEPGRRQVGGSGPQSSNNRSATQTQWLKSQVSFRRGKTLENRPAWSTGFQNNAAGGFHAQWSRPTLFSSPARPHRNSSACARLQVSEPLCALKKSGWTRDIPRSACCNESRCSGTVPPGTNSPAEDLRNPRPFRCP